MQTMTQKPMTPGKPLRFSVIRVPFFLEPDYPQDFEETNRVRLTRKWGGEAGWNAQKARHGLKERGEEVGIERFDLDRIASNTMASHRLVQWITRTKGPTASEALYDLLNQVRLVWGLAVGILGLGLDELRDQSSIHNMVPIGLSFLHHSPKPNARPLNSNPKPETRNPRRGTLLREESLMTPRCLRMLLSSQQECHAKRLLTSYRVERERTRSRRRLVCFAKWGFTRSRHSSLMADTRCRERLVPTSSYAFSGTWRGHATSREQLSSQRRWGSQRRCWIRALRLLSKIICEHQVINIICVHRVTKIICVHHVM